MQLQFGKSEIPKEKHKINSSLKRKQNETKNYQKRGFHGDVITQRILSYRIRLKSLSLTSNSILPNNDKPKIKILFFSAKHVLGSFMLFLTENTMLIEDGSETKCHFSIFLQTAFSFLNLTTTTFSKLHFSIFSMLIIIQFVRKKHIFCPTVVNMLSQGGAQFGGGAAAPSSPSLQHTSVQRIGLLPATISVSQNHMYKY